MSDASQFAAQVSRALRNQGIKVRYSGNPISWEGVRVSQSASAANAALVMVDYDTPTAEKRVADRVEAALIEAGYVVEHVGNGTTMTARLKTG